MNNSRNLIYSPQHKIPLGEAVILPDGTHALIVKWGHGNRAVNETIRLEALIELIMQSNIRNSNQRSL